MDNQSQPRFHGIYAPVTTPFTPTGEIIFSSLVSNIEKYLDSDLAGFLVAGSTGEAAHLEAEERIAVLDCVLESANGRPVMAGLSFSTLKQSLQFIRQLEGRNLVALLVSVPSYYKNRMNDVSLREYFRNLAEESPFPLLLYNFPRFTGIELSIELVQSLAELPGIVGMKDSSGNMIYIQKVLSVTQDLQFEVLSGNAETFGLARILGIQAGILAIGCSVPDLAAKLHAAKIVEEAEFRRILGQIHHLSTLIVGKLGVPGVKYAMDLRGLSGDYCRPPLLPLNETEKTQIEQAISQVLNDE